MPNIIPINKINQLLFIQSISSFLNLKLFSLHHFMYFFKSFKFSSYIRSINKESNENEVVSTISFVNLKGISKKDEHKIFCSNSSSTRF